MDLAARSGNTKVRIGVLILASTVVLTSSFIGMVAFITGFVSTIEQRLPVYVLITAIIFVTAIIGLDEEAASGWAVIVTTLSVTLLSFFLVTLSGEGMRYAASNPGALVSSQLVFYFIAAGLFCSGVGFWALHHWREFTEGGYSTRR